MDAVILAAGRNDRLKGIVPAYHKPLLVVNGRTLVANAVGLCYKRCDLIIVVVAPENAAPISQVLIPIVPRTEVLHIVVQPVARGPGEALWRGLGLCKSGLTLVICGDNIVSEEDVAAVCENGSGETQMGGKRLPINECRRFARLGEALVNEGPLNEWEETQKELFCWLGPLLVSTEKMYGALDATVNGLAPPSEIKIANHLNFLGKYVRPVETNCFDVGVPESLGAVG